MGKIPFIWLFSLRYWFLVFKHRWAMRRIEQLRLENYNISARIGLLQRGLNGRMSVETRISLSCRIDYYHSRIERNNNSIRLLQNDNP